MHREKVEEEEEEEDDEEGDEEQTTSMCMEINRTHRRSGKGHMPCI